MEKYIENTEEQILDDVYLKILYMFVSDDDINPTLKTPFIQGDYALASDGHMIICFNKKHLKYIVQGHKRAPDGLSIIPFHNENIDIVFTTKHLKSIVEQSRYTASKKYSIKLTNCPDCNGFGCVDFEFIDYKSRRHEVSHDCPTCEAHGRIERVLNLETNCFEVDFFNEYLLFYNKLFKTDYFDKLVKVAENLNQKAIILECIGDNNMHKFTVGDCIICFMPIHPSIGIDEDIDIITNI